VKVTQAPLCWTFWFMALSLLMMRLKCGTGLGPAM
jgi:hypothetical protein